MLTALAIALLVDAPAFDVENKTTAPAFVVENKAAAPKPAGGPAAHACEVWCGPGAASGVLVRHAGATYVVTCAHVATLVDVTVVMPDKAVVPGKTVAVNRETDLAVIVVAGAAGGAELAAAPPAAGAAVSQYGLSTRLQAGTVIGPWDKAGWFTTDAWSSNGDSGAGVFDAAGKVAGVHTGRAGTVGPGKPGSALVVGAAHVRAVVEWYASQTKPKAAPPLAPPAAAFGWPPAGQYCPPGRT